MKIWILGILLSAALIADAKQLNVSVAAKSAVLINAETGAILYEKSPHEPSYPASITKIATALYILEMKEDCLEECYTATEDAIAVITPTAKRAQPEKYPPHRLETDGTHMSIRAKETLPLRVMLFGLLLASGNDAANVMAENISGSVPQFVEGMNLYLKSKGIQNTSFSNPHGLHHAEHKTTAYDMAKITQEALKKPFFREIIKTVQYTRPQTNKQPASLLVQSNRLIKSGPLFYSKAIGGKTGYTAAAGHTLVAAAEKEGRTLIAVLLNCPEISQKYRDAITLFEAAFAERPIARTLLTREHDQFSLKIKGAAETLRGILAEDVKIDYYPSEEPKFKIFLHWDDIKLPIRKGDSVGKIQIATEQGFTLKNVALLAEQDVHRTWLQCCLDTSGRLLAILCMPRSLIILLLMGISILATVFYLKKKKVSDEAQ